MKYELTDLNSWPLDLVGWPIFNNSDEAILYAQLIYDDLDKQQHLVSYRKQTFEELRRLRETKDPDLDELMHLACKAQFFREAYTEALRIRDETTRLIGG